MAKLSRRVIARTVASKILAEPVQRQKWLRMAAAYLADNKQTNQADLLVGDIAQELFDQSGQLLVDVTSSRPLGDGVRRELKQLLAESTGAKSVSLTEHHDQSLIGGLIARTPSAELDLSVRTKLKQLATIK